MKTPLSICIPTLNRSSFLSKNLEAILKQDKLVEINVSDNASKDDTEEVVKRVQKKYPRVKINYFRHPKTVGFDYNVINVIKMASGNFCWMLGDDDLPQPGSISKIKKIISQHPDTALIHMNYSRFDQLLRKITAKRMVGDVRRDTVYTNPDEFYFLPLGDSYFKFLGTNVITMSTDVFNRKFALEAIIKIKKYIGLNFVQCFIAAYIAKKYAKIYYIAAPGVQYLANNHRVWPNHIWKDYNQRFLDFLIDQGFNKAKVLQMRRVQKAYEETEKLTRQPMVQYAYQVARPAISLLRYIRDSVKN